MQTPKIDSRTRQQLVAQLKKMASDPSIGWQPSETAVPDAGEALIQIFARYGELIIERINLLPENYLIAFLNLIGAEPSPPHPARVPLTFSLAENSPVDALVPRGSQVAAPPLEGEEEEVVFETVQEMLVTQAQLTAVFTRQPAINRDLYDNVTMVATTPNNGRFPLFTASQPMPHWCYIGAPELAHLKEPTPLFVDIHGSQNGLTRLAELPLHFQHWDGEAWQTITVSSDSPPTAEGWRLQLDNLPAVPTVDIHDLGNSWLRFRPNIPLSAPQTALALHALATGTRNPTPASYPYFPFGENGERNVFYINGEDAFGRLGAIVQIKMSLAKAGSVGDVTWDYLHTTAGGSRSWRRLATTGSSVNFGQSGIIQFTIPADGSWNVGLHRNQSGRWLRATSSRTIQAAPQIDDLSVTLSWNLPHIQDISLALSSKTVQLVPEAGYVNQLAIDLTKDFYPFGERPQFNDTLYLALGVGVEAGKLQGGDPVSLNFDLSVPGKAGGNGPLDQSPVVLLWEVWNGRLWQPVGKSGNNGLNLEAHPNFADNTFAFTRGGTVTLTLPETIHPGVVNGVEEFWLRVRLLTGHYGQDASYEPYDIVIQDNKITAYRLVPANFAPPIVRRCEIEIARNTALTVTNLLTENEFDVEIIKPSFNEPATFAPFRHTMDETPTLYLCFDRPFANRSVTLYAAVAPPAPDDVAPDIYKRAAAETAAQLVWEFSAGEKSWSRLAVLDETNGFLERGLIRFNGPTTFKPQTLFGQSGYWLRVRWENGRFVVPPELFYLLPNTTWAEQVQLIENESLGSSNGNPNQTHQLAQQPVLPGQVVQVQEVDLSDQAIFAALADGVSAPEADWVTWHEVTDFYASSPTDRHYMVDRQTGEVRFGDGQNGQIPPRGQNNIRAHHYRSGGGRRGNRETGSIVQVKTSLPYIADVINHEAAISGAEQASLAQVKRYGPRQLRHRDRAVTVEDVEDLAFAASSEVTRAKAIPPRFRPMDLWLTPGEPPKQPMPAHEQVEAGQMGLIIVPQSTARRPAPTPALVERVQQFLLERIPNVAKLWVSGPNWVEVRVSVAVVPTSLETADLVSETVHNALNSYLHPLTGGERGTGWAFGRQPYRSDLFAVLERVPGVDHIRHLEVVETPDMKSLQQIEQYLIYSGEHQVTVLTPLDDEMMR